MINQETKKLLEEMSRTRYGQALKEYLDIKIKELSSVDTAKTWEEVLGRQESLKIMKDVFWFIQLSKQEKEEKEKNQYV